MTPIEPEPREGYGLVVFAKDQPQYHPLLANKSYDERGVVETKWKLTWNERLHVILHGTLYLTVATFHKPLQPIRMSVLREE